MPSSRRSRPSRCCPTTRRSRSPRRSPPSSPRRRSSATATACCPRRELDRLSASGLLAVTVPAEHGGAGLAGRDAGRGVPLLATGDPSVAQIPHSHFVYVNALRHQGTPEQRRFFFGEVLAGKRFGNAQSEVGTKHVRDIRTTLTPAGRRALDARTAPRATPPARCSPTGSRCSPAGHAGRRRHGPLHVAWVERHAARRQRRRRLGRHGPAHDRQRHRRSWTTVEVPADRITPLPPDLRGPADLRRLRAGAARRHRRRHRPRGARRGRRVRPHEAPSLPGRRRRSRAADDPLVVQALRRDGARRTRRRGAAARGRPGRRRGRRRPDRRHARPTREPGGRRRPSATRPGVRRGRRAGCSRCPAPARPSTRSTSTATGATPAPTPCTTRPPGRSSTSAGTSLDGTPPPNHGQL